jgi:hypothetical protein
MSIPDETLMAYADGELDPVTRDAVESAIREDPQMQQRLAQHRALRQRVQSAYAAELDEDVPQRLLNAVRGTAGTPEVVGPARQSGAEPTAVRPRTRQRRWVIPVSMAASVIAGVGLGFFIRGGTPLVQSAEGALVAHGPLANALSNQLAADQASDSAVRMGVSFLAKSGDYCRTFTLPGAAASAGLACRRGKDWQIQLLTPGTGGGGGESGYRTAGSAMPEALAKSVEEQMAAEPLDQAGERAARANGWTTVER